MADSDLASLRAVLLGPEQRQLEELRSRIDDEEARAEALAEVLPRVLLQHAEDPRFATNSPLAFSVGSRSARETPSCARASNTRAAAIRRSKLL